MKPQTKKNIRRGGSPLALRLCRLWMRTSAMAPMMLLLALLLLTRSMMWSVISLTKVTPLLSSSVDWNIQQKSSVIISLWLFYCVKTLIFMHKGFWEIFQKQNHLAHVMLLSFLATAEAVWNTLFTFHTSSFAAVAVTALNPVAPFQFMIPDFRYRHVLTLDCRVWFETVRSL